MRIQGSMVKRISLVAGYDEAGIIHDYVVYLVRCLSHISQVYYYCDNELVEGEHAKLDGLAIICGSSRHGRYDFGSWAEIVEQIGWEKISKVDELILANDSCYGPFHDLSAIFNRMDTKICDFWGITSNRDISFHIQSYFLVFRKPVLENTEFRQFWKKIDKEIYYENIVLKYEIGLSSILLKNGFIPATYINSRLNENLTTFPLTMIRKFEMPFVKIKCFKDPYIGSRERISKLFSYIKINNKDISILIKKHLGKGFISKIIAEQKIDQPFYFNFGFIRARAIRGDRLKIIFFDRWRIIVPLTSAQMRRLSRLSCFHVNI